MKLTLCTQLKQGIQRTTTPLSQYISERIAHWWANCKIFTLTHYLADLFVMHRGPRSILSCMQHHIQLTFLSLQVNWLSHSWDTAISIFYLENPRSRTSMRSQFKVTKWVSHHITPYPFGSMSIGPPIHEIQHFQNLTLKIQGQGHRSRSQSKYNTQSTHISFIPCRSGLPLLGYSYFKIWCENSRSRSWVRSKSDVTTWVQHSVDSHPFWSMSIGHLIPVLWFFSKVDLENQGSSSWVRSKFKVTMRV